MSWPENFNMPSCHRRADISGQLTWQCIASEAQYVRRIPLNVHGLIWHKTITTLILSLVLSVFSYWWRFLQQRYYIPDQFLYTLPFLWYIFFEQDSTWFVTHKSVLDNLSKDDNFFLILSHQSCEITFINLN